MFEKYRTPFRDLSKKDMLALGAAIFTVTGSVAVPLQVAINQGNRPKEPEVELYNPITWAATPLSNLLQEIKPIEIDTRPTTPEDSTNH